MRKAFNAAVVVCGWLKLAEVLPACHTPSGYAALGVRVSTCFGASVCVWAGKQNTEMVFNFPVN